MTQAVCFSLKRHTRSISRDDFDLPSISSGGIDSKSLLSSAAEDPTQLTRCSLSCSPRGRSGRDASASLSRFFHKAKSFSSLEHAMEGPHGESAKSLEKSQRPKKKRRQTVPAAIGGGGGGGGASISSSDASENNPAADTNCPSPSPSGGSRRSFESQSTCETSLCSQGGGAAYTEWEHQSFYAETSQENRGMAGNISMVSTLKKLKSIIL